MERKEVVHLMKDLKNVFEIVRLVDIQENTQFLLENDELVAEAYECYAIWNKEKRCDDYISAQMISSEIKQMKFEFIDHDVFHVISLFITMDDQPFALEMGTKVNNNYLFDISDKSTFLKNIKEYNHELYKDTLTGAYNRRYYDENKASFVGECGLAMVDLDDFKNINDQYGHLVGDEVLKKVVSLLHSSVRSNDSIIRYGGDEFLIVFTKISESVFKMRLQQICNQIKDIQINGYEEIKVSASIGGTYYHEGINMFEKADQCMYEAKKEKGKVFVENYD